MEGRHRIPLQRPKKVRFGGCLGEGCVCLIRSAVWCRVVQCGSVQCGSAVQAKHLYINAGGLGVASVRAYTRVKFWYLYF